MKEKEFEVTFIGHHIINVEAEDETEAEEKALELFDGDFNDGLDVEVCQL